MSAQQCSTLVGENIIIITKTKTKTHKDKDKYKNNDAPVTQSSSVKVFPSNLPKTHKDKDNDTPVTQGFAQGSTHMYQNFAGGERWHGVADQPNQVKNLKQFLFECF